MVRKEIPTYDCERRNNIDVFRDLSDISIKYLSETISNVKNYNYSKLDYQKIAALTLIGASIALVATNEISPQTIDKYYPQVLDEYLNPNYNVQAKILNPKFNLEEKLQ